MKGGSKDRSWPAISYKKSGYKRCNSCCVLAGIGPTNPNEAQKTKQNQTNQTKRNQTKWNQMKPNQTKPNQTKPNQTRTDPILYLPCRAAVRAGVGQVLSWEGSGWGSSACQVGDISKYLRNATEILIKRNYKYSNRVDLSFFRAGCPRFFRSNSPLLQEKKYGRIGEFASHQNQHLANKKSCNILWGNVRVLLFASF